MRAIEQRGYGDPREVLHMTEVDLPTFGADQVLVRVHASSANPYDWHLIYGEPTLMRPQLGGIRAPRRIVGADFAGIVEGLGSDVRGLAPGDEVYGFADGAFAEYVAAPAGRLARKPANLTFAEAAAVPLAAITALQGLRHGQLTTGQHVLVVGASGGVGTFAVQLAKHAGAQVTGVCSTSRLDLVRSLGADHVIDYTMQDPASGPARYDLILQLGGTYTPRALRRALTPRGTLVQSYGDGSRRLGPLRSMASGALLNLVTKQRITLFVANEDTATLDELRDLIEAGHIRPIIDSTYPLERAAEAVALVKDGRPAGKVVVTITALGSADRTKWAHAAVALAPPRCSAR
jgi:NADPH:quinone reductase-like Zn-dependent oxidoreductase